MSSIDPMQYISINLFWLKYLGQEYDVRMANRFEYCLRLFYKAIVFIIAFIFPLTGEVIYFIYNHDDVSKLAEGLYLLISETFTTIKLLLFFFNKRRIQELIYDMNSDMFKPAEHEHEEIIRANIMRTRKVTTFYHCLCSFAIAVSLLIPIKESFEVHPNNMQFPYIDAMSSPAYEIIYFLQVLYKPSQVLIHCAMETMPPAFLASAIAQLDILTFNLENLDLIKDRTMKRLRVLVADDEGRTTAQRISYNIRLRQCIHHHQHILDYVQAIEESYNVHVGMQFTLSISIICLIGIKLLSLEDPLHQPVQLLWTSVYFCCMVTSIFMVCFFGNELIWKSDHLTTAVYSGPWISLDEGLKRSILIFRERCKKPMALRAMKLFDASLITFTKLMQWSYKAFAVMSSLQ